MNNAFVPLLFYFVQGRSKAPQFKQEPAEQHHSTSRPGSACSTVFILSRNVRALFSSPTGTVTVNRLVAPRSKGLAAAILVDARVGFATLVLGLDLPDRISMISGSGPASLGLVAKPLVAEAGTGRAAICGM